MSSFILQMFDNLLFISSFLLIVFSFFRPVRKGSGSRYLIVLLLLLLETGISWIFRHLELNMIFDALLFILALRLLFGISMRMLVYYYCFSIILLDLAYIVATMVAGAFFHPLYDLGIEAFFIPQGTMEGLLLTCGMLLLLVPICLWVWVKLPHGLQAMTRWETVQYLLAACVDMLAVLLVPILGGSAGIEGQTAYSAIRVTLALGIYLQLFFFFRSLMLGHVYIEKNQLAEKYLEEQKTHYEYLETRERDTRKFRHDVRSHMQILAQLASSGEQEELLEYIRQLTERVNTFGVKHQTSSGIADAIVNRYDAEAEKWGLQFTVRGQFPAPCHISSLDLCTILSNLLSNAFEGVRRCGGRKVFLEIRHKEPWIFLEITNDCDKKLRVNTFMTADSSSFADLLDSSKLDVANHGFGLENVRDSVKKCAGTMEIRAEQGTFRVRVQLTNKPAEEKQEIAEEGGRE